MIRITRPANTPVLFVLHKRRLSNRRICVHIIELFSASQICIDEIADFCIVLTAKMNRLLNEYSEIAQITMQNCDDKDLAIL